MESEISTNELFGVTRSTQEVQAPPPTQQEQGHAYDGSLADLKKELRDMTKGRLEYIVQHDKRKGARDVAQDELNRRLAPTPTPTPTPEPIQIDNAVNIRKLDWECVCSNTNTHSLARCGKCNSPRYTTI